MQALPASAYVRQMARRSTLWFTGGLAALSYACCLCAAGCTCGGGSALIRRGEGDEAYSVCARTEPGPDRSWMVGALRLAQHGRTLTIDGGPASPRLVVFAGAPGIEREVLEQLEPTLVAVLGGPFEVPDIGVPVIAVSAGDPPIDPPDHVIVVDALRTIRLGPAELVPVAGAPDGRYGRPGGCGLGEPDIDAFALDPPAEGYRLLLSWAGPAGTEAARGIDGVDAGSRWIAAIAEASHAQGAIFAWPRLWAGTVFGSVEAGGPGFNLAVPPGAGPWLERADGAQLVSEPTRLALEPRGPRRLDSPRGAD